MLKKYILLFNLCLVIYATATVNKNKSRPAYGDDWLLYKNENGVHILNYSTIPNDTDDLIYGDAYFYLSTRRNEEPEELYIPSDSQQKLTSEFFNRSNLVKVITHGWLSSMYTTWLQVIKNELLKHDDYNIIVVDWHEISSNPNYVWAALSTGYVGKKTASLLDFMAKSYNIDGKSVHLIGHSLGAHVMAQTAEFLPDYPIHKITGLDPARPLFELPMTPERCRLDKTDAEYVDIIHTSSGLLGYGTSQGDADFYPNGGTSLQPGCAPLNLEDVACSHGRAPEYFGESINTEIHFVAYPCESWDKFVNGSCLVNYTYMGLLSKKGDSGDYYLHTNDKPPFARGKEETNESD